MRVRCIFHFVKFAQTSSWSVIQQIENTSGQYHGKVTFNRVSFVFSQKLEEDGWSQLI